MNKTEKGEQAVNEILHFGIKGMKWGIRRERDSSGPVKTEISKNRRGKVTISTTGGSKSSASTDAVRAAQASQKLKVSGIKSLSNQELQALAKRNELENKIKAAQDTPMNKVKKQTDTINKGTNAVKAVLGATATIAAVYAWHSTPNGKLITGLVKKAIK